MKHGGYSLLTGSSLQGDLVRENPRVARYLLDARAGLVRDVAGCEPALSEMQRIMIDRIISKLAICRLIEIYIERYGAFRRDQIRRKVFELEPCLGQSYLAYSNSIDRALVALGLGKREGRKVIDAAAIIQGETEEKDEG